MPPPTPQSDVAGPAIATAAGAPAAEITLAASGDEAPMACGLGSGPGDNASDRPAPAAPTALPSAPAAAPAPAPATDRYIVLSEIGAGGMGIVYRATDTALDREVALKVLHDQYRPESGPARRFADEARITGQLQHPGIPPVHDLGTLPDGRPFLAMKLIQGRTLDDLLRERAAPSDDRGRFLAVFEHACHAIAYAHAHGVIHRDLKPANLMVGEFGDVQVMDWGLAKRLADRTNEAPDAGDPERTQYSSTGRGSWGSGSAGGAGGSGSWRGSDSAFTLAGAVLGTPAFMSPEQAAGAASAVDQRSDVFGLGAVLSVILSNRPPFAAPSVEATRLLAARGKIHECFARLDACGADPGLVALCKRCLAPDPADRPADAGVVARAVADLRHEADERARRAELERVRAEGERAAAEVRVAEQRKRRRAQAALGMTFTTMVVLAGGFAWWTHDQRRTRREAGERDTARAIQAAEARYAQARGADRDLALWAEARAAALQAVERAAGAPPDVRQLAAALLAEIEQVGKNRRLVAALLEVRAGMGDELVNSNQDFAGADARYARAFREYGADIEALPPERAAELLRGLGGSSTIDLAAALDDWAYARSLAGRLGPKGLFAVTRLLDPDPLRNRARDAVAAQDAAALAALAREIDPATQPVQTIDLLVVWQYAMTPSADRPAVATDLIAFLKRAHPHHPGDFQINHNIAFYHIAKREYAEALPYALAALAARPNSQAAWEDCARARVGLKRYDEAVETYRRMAAMGISPWRCYALAGSLLAQQGKADEAREEFRRAAAAAPADPGFERWIASGYTVSPAFLDEALPEFRRIAESGPANPAVHYVLGALLSLKGDLPAARDAFREGTRLDPSPARTLVRYRKQLIRLGLFAEAAAACREDLRINPASAPNDSSGTMCAATLLLYAGDAEGYRQACRRAFELFEKSSEPADLDRTAKAALLPADSPAEWLDKARALADRAVTGTESHRYHRLFLACKALADYRGGDFAAAAAVVRDGFKPTDRGFQLDASAYAILAMALHRQGQADQARAALASARAILDARMPDPARGRPFDLNGWCDWLQADLLTREAETLLRRPPG